MSNWQKVRLGDVCEYYTGRIAVKLLDEARYISTENMLSEKGGIIVSSGLPTIPVTSEYKKDNILVSNIRPYFKKIWYASYDGGCSNDVLVLKAKKNCFPRFLYYILSDDKFFDYSTSTSKGTKMPRGDKAAIMQYSVPDIPYEKQRAIAATLSCLDDKIELNRRINANLEAQAQAIFKSWFVDFEPFRGGEFVESELGKIPAGWRVGIISDFAKNIVCGKTPSTKNEDYYGDAIPFITIPDMRNNVYVITTERFLSKSGEKSQSNKTIPENSICVSCIATTGLVSLTSEHSQTNQQINTVICADSKSYIYVYLYMKSLASQISALASSGSAAPNLNKEQFSKIKMLMPSVNIVHQFFDIIEPMFLTIKKIQGQSRTLTAIRDTLLPRLMSGEIEVEKE